MCYDTTFEYKSHSTIFFCLSPFFLFCESSILISDSENDDGLSESDSSDDDSDNDNGSGR